MRENRVLRIVEIEGGLILGQFQVGLVEGADGSNIVTKMLFTFRIRSVVVSVISARSGFGT